MSLNGVVVDLSGADALPADVGVLQTVFPGTNKKTGWNVTFAGPGHPKAVARNNEVARQQLLRSAEIERCQVNGRQWKGEDDKSPERKRREFVDDIVAVIVSWTPVNFGDGPVEFNEGDATAPSRAVDLLMKPKLGGFVKQFADYLLDERSFMKGSATD